MTARSIRLGLATLAGVTIAATVPARADEILVRGGGRISGVIVERTDRAVVVETGPGRVALSLSRVERIVPGRSPLESWRERAAGLDPRDARGWASLARWAEEAGLGTQASEAWSHVLAVDPQNADANRGLGRVEVNGAWLDEEAAYRARGYVRFEDRWVTPAEHEALVRERAADEAAEQARSELRVREAEARAREAEARAQEADSAAMAGYGDGSIPLWWGVGGYGFGGAYGPAGRRGSFGPHVGVGMRGHIVPSPHVPRPLPRTPTVSQTRQGTTNPPRPQAALPPPRELRHRD
jgi:hypothetical protein